MSSNGEVVLPTRPKEHDAANQCPVAMGSSLKSLFLMDEKYRNMNNGSFGTIPRAIQARQRAYQDMAEARPDPFIRYEYGSVLDESREAVAKLVNAPLEATVFVPNATTGVNVVLRGLAGEWACEARPEGEGEGEGEGDEVPQNEILYFNTIYAGCGKSVDYVVETSGRRIGAREIGLGYPCEDEEVVRALERGIRESKEEGKRPRLAIFDVVSSLPGVCVPYPELIALCKREGVLSLVDGAQGVGMVGLDLGEADPDFFVSNCHKWLHVPRGCAVFVVPVRNQGMLPSTLPTSHGYEPRRGKRFSPLPPREDGKSKYVENFEFVGTVDNAPYLCAKDSISWRREVLGGEQKILGYMNKLAREGGDRVAEMVGTGEVLENKAGTLGESAMVNVALPLVVKGAGEEWASHVTSQGGKMKKLETDPATLAVLEDAADAGRAVNWMLNQLIHEHNTFVALYVYRKRFWARISAQVFLDMDDFVETGKVLKEVCERVGKGDWA
ncbi:uncharacterized protein MKZ38_005375 [Zalerion maritima]|uniref:Aminotransferase class V domain-containing protein n=1 Tax=Zalerion maritima TaxID=339359 RepID=A0AAD5RX01_9PEZI|nr:uncharacterized protein MKZ38_005375 [Zalerion maritima]